MNRRDFLQSAGAASLLLGSGSTKAEQKTPVLQRLKEHKYYGTSK